jgi:NAD(P)-dependent dehydrogenase (short-subunit alcohol dehydrogenase family)
LGFNTVRYLAQKGAKVYVSARSLDKANGAIKLLLKENPALADLLHPLSLDLGDLQRVGDIAKTFAKNESRLDILVNNAAV